MRLRTRSILQRGLWAVLVCCSFSLAGLLVCCAWCDSSYAWLTYRAVIHASVNTGEWTTHSVCLSPGCAKAPHVNPAKPSRPIMLPVATVNAGALSLDFGDQQRGACATFCDVFRIESLVDRPLTVTFTPDAAVAPFVCSVRFGGCGDSNVLEAGSTRSVDVKLTVPRSVPEATYTGTLTLGIGGSTEQYEVPMKVSVVRRSRLKVAPGLARAPHFDGNDAKHPQLLPIAVLDDQGAMRLDLGDQRQKSSDAYDDVLRLTSLVDESLRLTLTATGDAAQFIKSIAMEKGKNPTLRGHETRSLTVKLSVARDAPLGQHAGSLRIAVAGSPESYEIPLVVAITGPDGAKAPDPAGPTRPPVPSPLPTAEPIPAPDPVPTGTPTPTPSADPQDPPIAAPEPPAVPDPTPTPTSAPSPKPEPAPSPTPTPEPIPSPPSTPEPTSFPAPTLQSTSLQAANLHDTFMPAVNLRAAPVSARDPSVVRALLRALRHRPATWQQKSALFG